MATSNYSMLEEEVISTYLFNILQTLKVHAFYSERLGLEVSMQNGKVQASNLNIYKTRPESVGNINCIIPPLSEQDGTMIKSNMYEILRILKVNVPHDMFGNIEVIADYDPMNKMRVRNIMVQLRSTFKLTGSANHV